MTKNVMKLSKENVHLGKNWKNEGGMMPFLGWHAVC